MALLKKCQYTNQFNIKSDDDANPIRHSSIKLITHHTHVKFNYKRSEDFIKVSNSFRKHFRFPWFSNI